MRVIIAFLSFKLEDAGVVLWPASCTSIAVTYKLYCLTPHTTFTQQTKTIRNERDTKFLSTPLRNQVFSLDQTFEPWFVYTSISQTFLVMELFTTSEYLRNTFVLITSEIEPATLRVVAQCLTQLRNHVPLLRTYVFRKYSLILKSSMTKNVWEMLV